MKKATGQMLYGCDVTGKIRIPTRKKAKQFAKRQQRIHELKFRSYQCPHCKDWHLATIKR